ncbi:MAG: nitroreductase family protein [Gammaproteobacteria bacterium]|jgi:nitroreductase|nr:nitroreductase family protein [Pseudomonadota bacterium]MCZ6731821.1 nitroreductase family protein [Gammaproteobacteria bacterium]
MLTTEIEISKYRKPDHDIEPILFHRWSPRAMSGEEISEQELMILFEAARWAPSSYNAQPWRFLYARRGTANWDRFFDLMVEFNQGWTKHAAVLMVVVSRKTFESNDQAAPTHSFDAGAAWQNLALQGSTMGLVVHGMQGFDYEKARAVLNIPEHFQVDAMIAVGKPGKREDLPEDLQEREQPSDRKPVAEIVIEGGF